MREYDPSGTIAMFIASALQHPNPRCNGNNRRMSTIYVDQHKNKFNLVVVYCSLAEDNLVSEAWASEGHDGDPSDDFVGKCMLRDAQVYRSAYRKMIWLVPQHKEMILGRADHGYLLYDSVDEVDKWIGELVARCDEHPNHKAHLDRVLRDWRVASTAELKAKLEKVYKYDW